MDRMKLLGTSALLSVTLFSFASVAQGKTEIRYGVWDRNQLPAVEKIVANFEKANPDIDVVIELTPYKQYWVKLNAAASGDVAPDVFWMNMPNFQTYAKHGLLAPIDENVKKDGLDLSQFVSSSVQAYQYQGNQYGIPRDIDSIAVWYNKEIFDAAGVSYPTGDWTWDDMVSKATAIKEANANVYPMMMNITSGQTAYFNLLLQSGANIISADKSKTDIASPAAISAYKRVLNLMDKGLLPSANKISELKSDDVFQSGKAAMVYSGSWSALPFSKNEQINKKIGVVTMPKIERNAGVSHSIAYVMSAKTEHKSESWRFVSYLSSDEAQSILGESKTVIPAKSSVSNSWVASYSNIDVSAYTKALQVSHQYPTAANTAKWHSLLNDAIKKVWQGQDPEKVMEQAEKKIQRILSKG